MKPSKMIILIAAVTTAAFAAEPAATVKLRRLELKTIHIEAAGHSVPFSYADAVKSVMLTTGPRGTNADDLVKTIEAWEPMKKDIEGGKPALLLDEPAYDTLIRKINDMAWAPNPDIAEAVANFISYVRGLKEEDFDATPSTAPPPKAK